MQIESDKVMFEIYRDAHGGRDYRVVYFTELDDHNKASEIARAMDGQHVYDGFLRVDHIDEGKEIICQWLAKLNAGLTPNPADIEATLAECLEASS